MSQGQERAPIPGELGTPPPPGELGIKSGGQVAGGVDGGPSFGDGALSWPWAMGDGDWWVQD